MKDVFEFGSRVREDFPLLKRQVRGKPLVYLDSAATAQKPIQVIEAVKNFYEKFNANVHRGVYSIAEEATAAYEEAREKVARFINARSPREIVFTRNATEAINLVMYSWGLSNVRRGDVLLTTEMEHHSNLVPWQNLSKLKGAELKFVGFNEEGFLRLEELDNYKDVRLFAFTFASNVLGTINPVRELVKYAKEAGAVTVVDAAQAVPHMPVDVQQLGCDFMAFSGHKMLGPMGIGVLYGKERLLEEMEPFMVGGEMVKAVDFRGSEWNEIPWKFEAGTPNVEGALGLAAAIDYLERIGMDAVRKHEVKLTEYALDTLIRIDGFTYYGPSSPEQRCGLVSFNLRGIHPHDLAALLDEDGIAIRAGHHCAMPLHSRLGIAASARISFYIYNIPSEVDFLAESLKKIKRVLEA
ncbi:MAG: cysteine desulfurase [Candidatus Terraquivivens tikiterensis]|uniref:Cysteine desulfurase n=1 Tax=Candidatus Terraquivivens tikiterensis TaxID=1980982 RepID=A0A2R7Y9M8_9ARCH|nr:MAG: cysteine desulfurase [Candidatus Terraquivivens tikiterensis]